MSTTVVGRAPVTGGEWTIPGDPPGVDELGRALAAIASAVGDCGYRLGRAGSHAADWTGRGARAFTATAAAMLPRWKEAGSAFSAASAALLRYSADLVEAQGAARAALGLYEEGEALSAAWSASVAASGLNRNTHVAGVDPPPIEHGPDPGAPLMAEALARMAAARSRAEDAAARLAVTLQDPTAAAPRQPSLWDRFIDVIEFPGREQAQFAVGVVAGVASLAAGTAQAVHAVWSVSPGRLGSDPSGWLRSVRSDASVGAEVAADMVHRPAAMGRSMAAATVDAQEWRKNPVRAAGELLPLVASGFTGEGEDAAAARLAEATTDEAREEARAIWLARRGGSDFQELTRGWRGTNMSTEKSFAVHYIKRHGELSSPEQYSADAREWASSPSGRPQETTLKDGTSGTIYRDAKRGRGGILDEHGYIISFWYH